MQRVPCSGIAGGWGCTGTEVTWPEAGLGPGWLKGAVSPYIFLAGRSFYICCPPVHTDCMHLGRSQRWYVGSPFVAPELPHSSIILQFHQGRVWHYVRLIQVWQACCSMRCACSPLLSKICLMMSLSRYQPLLCASASETHCQIDTFAAPIRQSGGPPVREDECSKAAHCLNVEESSAMQGQDSLAVGPVGRCLCGWLCRLELVAYFLSPNMWGP